MSGIQGTRAAAPVVPAAVGRRVGAYVIDGAIGFGVVAVVGGVCAAILQVALHPADERGLALLILWLNLVVLLVGVAWGLVYTAMQGGRGSLGQRALGLRLTDQDGGGRVGFWRALLRNVVWGLACSIVVGYFTPLFDGSGRRQGWHDLVARAIVIDARASDAAVDVPPPPRPATANPYLPPPAGAVASAPPLPPAPPTSFAPPASSRPPAPSPTGPGGVAPIGEPAPRPGTAYAPAAPAAPAMPIPTGMISEVPGISSSAAAAPAPAAPAPAPAASVPVASPAAPATPAAAADDLDATRAAPGAPPAAVLVWDNGTRVAVYGRTLFGRNPAPEDGTTVVAVRDETLSLSKTHFELDGDASGAWIVDRHSTNGVVLVRDASRHRLVAGERTALRAGDRLEFGDRSATMEVPA